MRTSVPEEVLTGELGIEPSQELAAAPGRILGSGSSASSSGASRYAATGCSSRLGKGRSSLCFRAIQPHVERDVAVRIMRESKLADDPDFARRFEVDAQAVAALEHPHIAPVYDYWREPGRAYVISRYLRGGFLHDLEARGEPLDAQAATNGRGEAGRLCAGVRPSPGHGRLRSGAAVQRSSWTATATPTWGTSRSDRRHPPRSGGEPSSNWPRPGTAPAGRRGAGHPGR